MPSSNRRGQKAHTADLLDPVVIKIIRSQARRVCRHPGFNISDLPDVEQTLMMGLAARRPFFRPRRGAWRAFAKTVVGNLAASLRSSRLALCRSPGRESESRGDWSADRRRPNLETGLPGDTDLRIDLSKVLGGLPPNLQSLAALLGQCSLATAARRLGIPRRTARDRLRRLRECFDRAGLREYC